MDCRSMLLCVVAIFLLVMLSVTEGRNKKVVIHVPYKVKKIKHTHTIYKTIHHHHSHDHHPILHDHHLPSPSEEHEHFHHMHVHDDPPSGQHSQPVPGIGLPDFLPDVPMDLPLELPDVPHHEIQTLVPRLPIPIYRRTKRRDPKSGKTLSS